MGYFLGITFGSRLSDDSAGICSVFFKTNTLPFAWILWRPEFIEGGLKDYLASEGAIVSGFLTPEFELNWCICGVFIACLAAARKYLGKESLKTFCLLSYPRRLVFKGSIFEASEETEVL